MSGERGLASTARATTPRPESGEATAKVTSGIGGVSAKVAATKVSCGAAGAASAFAMGLSLASAGAPSAIHLRIVSISSGFNGSPEGGMNGSSSCLIRRTSRLPSGSPGLKAGPELPPSLSSAKLVTAKPLLRLSGL
jgi:hypothetical protein